MKNRNFPPTTHHVNIRVSGTLFQGHLPYLQQLVHTAADCRLWPILDLSQLLDLDHAALLYLAGGEGKDFGIASCPVFVRERVNHERHRAAA